MDDKQLSFKKIYGFPSKENLNHLIALYEGIFDDAKTDFFTQRIEDNTDVLSLICFYNEKPVAFKIGYKYNEDTFYSWIGGVLPEFRRKGIAKELAKLQEDWAKKHRYKTLRTKSMNRFKPMLILNLKNGFDIKQVYTNDSGQTKIVFEKSI